MPAIDVERYYEAISDQTSRFATLVRDADLSKQVPTCPEWTVAELVEHVGRVHRRSAALVAAEAEDATQVPQQTAVLPADQAAHESWLVEGAEQLIDALRAVGPESPLWNPAADGRSGADYWLRRMLHETTVHRADATFAIGVPYELEPELAADAISEWLALLCSPGWAANRAGSAADLRGNGETLHLHATDEPSLGEAGEWLIRRDADSVRWEYGHLKADVAIRGPAVRLMLVLTRRLTLNEGSTAHVQVFGDAELLQHWLDRTVF